MDPITGNALLAAGSKLLGGVLSRKGPSLRKQANVQRNAQIKYERDSFRQSMSQQTKRFKTLVEAAQKAGFNPSTALASGGLAAGGAAQMGMGQPQTPFNLGTALADAVGVYADKMDPIALETAELNNEIAKQQLANLQNESLNPYGAVRPVRQNSQENEEQGPQVGETGYGDPINQDPVRQEAIDARLKDSGYWGAYSLLDAPEWWPTAGYMQESFGDDSWVTKAHARYTPWVVGLNNKDEIKEFWQKSRENKRIREGEREARKQYADSRRPKYRGTQALQDHMQQNFPTVFD